MVLIIGVARVLMLLFGILLGWMLYSLTLTEKNRTRIDIATAVVGLGGGLISLVVDKIIDDEDMIGFFPAGIVLGMISGAMYYWVIPLIIEIFQLVFSWI